MKVRPTPLSDRLAEAMRLGRVNPEDLREVQGLEKIAAGNVTHVAVNGKNPKDWTIERWITVLTFAGMVTGGIVAAIWAAGSKSTLIVEQHSRLIEIVSSLDAKVTAIQEEQRRVMNELLAADLLEAEQARSKPTPAPARRGRAAFPSSERLMSGEPEQ